MKSVAWLHYLQSQSKVNFNIQQNANCTLSRFCTTCCSWCSKVTCRCETQHTMTLDQQNQGTARATQDGAVGAYKTVASRIFSCLEHLLCHRPTFRGRVPLRSTSHLTLRQPWPSRGAQAARPASLRRYDYRGPMSASRGTKDARSRQPATTARAQRGSK